MSKSNSTNGAARESDEPEDFTAESTFDGYKSTSKRLRLSLTAVASDGDDDSVVKESDTYKDVDDATAITASDNGSPSVHNNDCNIEDNNTEDEDTGTNNDDESWWEDTCKYIQQHEVDKPAFLHLESWNKGSTMQDRAQEKLGIELDDCKSILEEIAKQFFEKVAVPIHEKVHSVITSKQSQLSELIVSNHKRRQELLLTLEEYNRNWDRKYQKLTSNILNNKADGENEMAVNNSETDQEIVETESSEQNNGDDGDINWNDIATAFPDTSIHIESLLQGTDRLNNAEDQLRRSLDSVHHQLQQSTDRLLQVVVHLHQAVTPAIQDQRQELQQLLSSNSHRRKQVQCSLEESVKRTQGILTSLLARVSSGFKKSS